MANLDDRGQRLEATALSTEKPDKAIEYVQFRQHQSATFHNLKVSKSVILLVRSGWKTIRSQNFDELKVKQGEFAFLYGGENLTIGNYVGSNCLYFTEGLIVSDAIVSNFLRVYPNSVATKDSRKCAMSAALTEVYSRTVADVQASNIPQRVLIHRVHELLLWLQTAGICIRVHSAETLSDRVRVLLERDLTKPWKAPNAAQELGMSEATLRRRLSREGTRFTELLRDARLTFALMRIQTSDRTLAEIAYESGFTSQARLTEAFKSRFAISPGKIRASSAQIDRNS